MRAPNAAERDGDWLLGLAPQVLAERPEELVFLGLALVALVLVAIADLAAPPHATVGAIGILPVLAGAWFLSRPQTVFLVLMAVLLRALVASLGGVHPITAAAEIITIPVLAVIARIAAVNTLRTHENEVRAERLEQGRQRAAELEKAKSQFLRLASHELRGPIAILLGYLSLMEEGELGELPVGVREALPVMRDKGRAMNDLIEQMLDTARLEDSRLQLKKRPLDLRPVIRDALATVEAAEGAAHRVVMDEMPKDLPALADPARIKTIVANLLDNALKYSPEGGLVHCHAQRTGDQVKISISDSGVGIAPEDLPRLFSRFGRIVTRETQGIPGTGLGLYLSRELARLHGGDLTVESAPGQGSMFVLSLPVLAQPLAREVQAAGLIGVADGRRRQRQEIA